jgi:phenylalanine-4-hydroxylase
MQYVDQRAHPYSEEDHEAWRRLYQGMQPLWDRYANPFFLQGLVSLRLDPARVPKLEDVNRFLKPLTGFQAMGVSGYLSPFLFFDCLRHREFPTTLAVRPLESLDYLPEPDIFHDVAGHVPMHTHPAFAEALVRFGECAHTAAGIASAIRDPRERTARLTSIVQALARFFWFTVEFGLMRHGGVLKAYGSGLLSSRGELVHALESPGVQRSNASLEWIIHQSFEIDHYQPLLFVVDGFDHLYALVGELEQWMRAGRLDHVAPGQPALSSDDLRSFLPAA